MSTESSDLRQQLQRFGQEHLLDTDTEARDALLVQIAAIDFDRIARLYSLASEPAAHIDPEAVEPFPVIRLPRTSEDRRAEDLARQTGLELLNDGKVAVVLVAGGQGTRLGFDHPKGMFPIGPVKNTSLFQIYAETIIAWRRRTRRPIPWYIMTSPTNDAETKEYFDPNHYFGLPDQDVNFFVQGTMPAVDLQTGKVLLAEKGTILTSPNGHGGLLLALRDEGMLEDMAERGIELIYYFQVDNPFAKILDPVFLGYHHRQEAQVSLKVVHKKNSREKLGVLVSCDGKPTVIEYSDLPPQLGDQTDENGELVYGAGSIAIHTFDRKFLEQLTEGECALPFHIARKKVPHTLAAGKRGEPDEPNAIKFELFIFDVLPLANKVVALETDRAEEFIPIKNATGEDSPALAQEAMIRRAGQWLQSSGVQFPTTQTGQPAIPLEISPLAGLSAEEFAAGLSDKQPITEPKYFGQEVRV